MQAGLGPLTVSQRLSKNRQLLKHSYDVSIKSILALAHQRAHVSKPCDGVLIGCVVEGKLY